MARHGGGGVEIQAGERAVAAVDGGHLIVKRDSPASFHFQIPLKEERNSIGICSFGEKLQQRRNR